MIPRKLYEKHAQRFGTEGVLDTALDNESWSGVEFCLLVQRMRRQDRQRYEAERAAHKQGYLEPAWRPTRAQVERLAALTEGEDPTRVARMLGVGRRTVIRARQAALQAAS